MKILKFILSTLFAVLFNCGCNDLPHRGREVTYPDLISPIYYVDTFQIISPRIALVDSVPYIFSLEQFEQFENKEDFIKQKGVIRYLTPEMHSLRFSGYLDIHKNPISDRKPFQSLAYQCGFEFGFDLEVLFLPDGDIEVVPIYKFAFKPRTFILTIVSTKFHLDMYVYPIEGECFFVPAVFSKDYILAIAPIYSKRDLKKINKLHYQWLLGEEPDWKYYLPDWLYNLLF